MYNLTSKNKSQSLMSDRSDNLENFLESSLVEELDDAASAAVNGGDVAVTDDGSYKERLEQLLREQLVGETQTQWNPPQITETEEDILRFNTNWNELQKKIKTTILL